ncbi:hypothetical protein CIB84_009280, partial [Bambusicola thoracicus]
MSLANEHNRAGKLEQRRSHTLCRVSEPARSRARQELLSVLSFVSDGAAEREAVTLGGQRRRNFFFTIISTDKSGSKAAEVGDDFLGDFVVGERVWVNGVKPGVIQYLGETQFAPGQWAGVVLDDPVGKNDGSVGGVRYFECQPLQGIFTRPSKLTRQPVAEGSGSDVPSVDSLTAQNLSLHSGTATPPLSTRVIPLRESVLNSAMKTGNESGSNLSDSGSVKKGEKDLRLGDRVL